MSYARNLARLAATGITTVSVNQDLRDLVIYDGNYPQMAQTKGGTSVGDGEGGMWRWQADSVGVDNGQNVLLPTGQSSSVPGRWIRQSDESSTQVFDTTQDLRDFEIVPTANYDTAQTLGAKNRGDGGGGLWRWEPLRTDVDNYGVFLLPTGQNIAEPGRWIRNREQNEVKASWWGLSTGGNVDSSPAIQAAIDYAGTQVGTSAFEGGVTVDIPSGEYLCNSELVIAKQSISLSGPQGRGPILMFADKGIYIGLAGDYTTNNVYGVQLHNLQLSCNNKTSTSSVGITCFRTSVLDIRDVEVRDFYIGIDGIRMGSTNIESCWLRQSSRLSDSLALIRLQGTDETAYGNNYAPGGGIRISNCEILGTKRGQEAAYECANGVLVHSVDGLYIDNSHVWGCNVALNVDPKGTAENHVIATIQVSNVYFDGPAGNPVTGSNIKIGGIVRKTISESVGTGNSIYIDLVFSNTYFRAGGWADNNVVIDVTDADGWANENSLEPVQFSNCEFRRAKSYAMVSVSGSLGLSGLMISNCFFDEYNEAGAANDTQGAAIVLNAKNIQISNCTFKNTTADTNWIVLLSDAVDSAVIVGNDFTQSKSIQGPLRQTLTDTANAVIFSDNAYPGYGRNITNLFKAETTDAATKSVRLYSVSEGNAGYITATITGSTLTGKTVAARYAGAYRRLATANLVIDNGTSKFSVVGTPWNPDALSTLPDVSIGDTDIYANFHGVTAETWYWAVKVDLIEST